MTIELAPGHRRPMTAALVRFLVTGGLSVGVDLTVLTLLHEGLGAGLFLATSLGYLTSLAVNYSLNHAWVFQAEGSVARRLGRYAGLVLANYLLTVVIVTSLAAAGLYYLIAKCVAVAVNAVLNFVSFRFWVFR